MPQMMPINWIISLFFFICIYILFNIMNYYIYHPNMNNNNKMNIKLTLHKNFNWKW
uniref:ATP synthase complex subunit 8 n=1 Tax=Marumba gaschkewitschii TaxID=704158 RepID=A0A8E6TRT7_9NEOP|nr:ATP synthase F0 subunit 8 [Marumba gaschkewitschii]QVT10999.1 ATP synthase F0 subunit 8 [Marumba gaschkewitschii]UXR12287.1 ATP synthase F0 subunit 8 [Marumba gaschkewitschii]